MINYNYDNYLTQFNLLEGGGFCSQSHMRDCSRILLVSCVQLHGFRVLYEVVALSFADRKWCLCELSLQKPCNVEACNSLELLYFNMLLQLFLNPIDLYGFFVSLLSINSGLGFYVNLDAQVKLSNYY